MDLKLLNRTHAKILTQFAMLLFSIVAPFDFCQRKTSGLHINQLLRNIQAVHVTSRCQDLFPPHPFFKGKALGTRLSPLVKGILHESARKHTELICRLCLKDIQRVGSYYFCKFLTQLRGRHLKTKPFPFTERMFGCLLELQFVFSTSLFSFQYRVSHRQTSGHITPVQPAYGSRGCLYLKSFSMEFSSDTVSFLRQKKTCFMKT